VVRADAGVRGVLDLRGVRIAWGTRTYVMGIVNVTPDSFSGDGLEDAAQAVAFAPRDDVDVKMRDALADDIIHCDEAAFGLHHLLNFSSEHLRVQEKWADERSGQIRQGVIVRLRNEQDMAGEKRAHVEKSHGDVVFENNFGFEFARHNFAEKTEFFLAVGCFLQFFRRARLFHAFASSCVTSALEPARKLPRAEVCNQ